MRLTTALLLMIIGALIGAAILYFGFGYVPPLSR